jgi:uncharacterized membrane protein HdeD (DUF308 family)
MDARSPEAVAPPSHPALRWSAYLLLAVGLLGHVYAAHAMGGSRVAYTHHVLGFFLILIVTGAIITGIGWRVRRTHGALILLVIGVVQALIGLWIAAAPLRAASGS